MSKRSSNQIGFQLDTTIDKGPRTIGFKLTSSSGDDGALWRDGAAAQYLVLCERRLTTPRRQTIDVYLNGELDDGALEGTVTASQQNSVGNVTIGRRPRRTGFEIPAGSTTSALPTVH